MKTEYDSGSKTLTTLDDEISVISDEAERDKLMQDRKKVKEIIDNYEYNKQYARRLAERSARDSLESLIALLVCILLIVYMFWHTIAGSW